MKRRAAAFLRGINLGNRRLKMDELLGHLRPLPFESVATFLASGNVILEVPVSEAPPESFDEVEEAIEARLQDALGYEVETFVRPLERLGELAARGAEEVGEDEGFKPHVLFLGQEAPEGSRASLTALESADDRFVALGREMIWLRRGGLSDAPIGISDLERALGGVSHTMRTLNTVRRIVGKFGA